MLGKLKTYGTIMDCMSKILNSLDEMDKFLETQSLKTNSKLAENLNRAV